MTDLTENAANVASDVVGSIHARPKPAADGAPSPKRNKVDHPATLAVGASDTRNAGSNDALSSSAEASTPRSSPEPGSRGTGPGKRARGDGLSEKNWYQQKKDRNKQQKNRKSEEKKEGKAEQKSETRNSDAPKDLRKRKVAFLFGYNGDGFQGLQAQSTTENTIEHVLETAMHKAGAISDANHGSFQKTGWTRAARTDKGVHAAANVVALKLLTTDDLQQTTARIQSFLPPQIRVLGTQFVTQSFHAKLLATSRRYEYVIPSYAFQPLEEYLSWFKQRLKDDPSLAVLPPAIYIKPRTNVAGKGAAAGKPEASSATSSSASTGPVQSMDTSDGVHSSDTSKAPTVGASAATSARSAPEGTLLYQRPIQYLQPLHYRISPERKEYVAGLFKRKFHNFTIGKKPTEASASRYIMAFDITGVYEKDGLECLRLEVQGASFMLHQIRRMVGWITAIARGVVPEADFYKAFNAERLRVPTVPGFPLLLNQVIFDTYRCKIERDHKDRLQTMEELFVEKNDDIQKFKQDFIYPSIFREELEKKTFVKWMQSCLDERGFWGLPADAVSDVRLRAIEQQVEDDEERVEPGDD